MDKKATNLKRLTYNTSNGEGVPKGATILSKDVSVNVEEIENGFLIVKNYDIKYQMKDNTGYAYITKKWFSEKNPLDINLEGLSLADKFDK